LPEADEKRKINKTETGILCSEDKMFRIIVLIYKKNSILYNESNFFYLSPTPPPRREGLND
jgi:hypothetical protein